MLGSLQTGVSGLQEFQQRMDVIGNNIANVNTSGYKTARIDFADAFSQSLQTTGTAGSMQVGTGVTTASIKNQYTQGSLIRTGNTTDLAIVGEGFFVVKDDGGQEFATRAGEFKLDDSGYLVTNQGLRVQGYSDAGLSARGDIRINETGAPVSATPGAKVTSFGIGSDGLIRVRLDDGTEFDRGQVLLQLFQDPQALVKEGNNLLSGFSAAGPLAQIEVPGRQGLGKMEAGALEMSNVDLAGEMSSLITTQRAFQASARIITTSDELLQEVVNLKR